MRRAISRGFASILAGFLVASPATGADIILRSGSSIFTIDPATLKLEAENGPGARVLVSAPQKEPGKVMELRFSETNADWKYSGTGICVRLAAENGGLTVRFKALRVRRITWPIVHPSPEVLALIMPLGEGAWVPASNTAWTGFLAGDSDNSAPLSERFSMPFLGLGLKEATITVLMATPFNTDVSFLSHAGKLGLEFTRTFVRPDKIKEHVCIVRFGSPSPVEPARQYRNWLVERGQLVTLAEKIRRVPRASRLPGALHAYLWGFRRIHPDDVRDWAGFCKLLARASQDPNASTGLKIWSLLSRAGRKEAAAIAKSRLLPAYSKAILAREINRLIEGQSLFVPEAWTSASLPGPLREAAPGFDEMTPAGKCEFNSALLCAAYPGHFQDPEKWGDGVSTKFLNMLGESGVDRACLLLSDLNEGDTRPETARLADSMGYLYGPYDSYHSVHLPDEHDTWTTAQFGDSELYEKGAIVGPEGKPLRGFKGKGRLLSPLAARPHVEKRVKTKMGMVPFSAWFLDCDAYGQYFDNYSRFFPHTQAADLSARLERIKWLAETFDLPVGSETGSALAASAICFSHGMLTPYFGWSDADFKDAKSPYWLGGYWPPEEPRVFFLKVPLKPRYALPYFDPRFRLPLYEIVFHDSVVATHHWCYSSLKFTDQYATRALLEQLYNVPPLYHFTVQEFKKERRRVTEHYRFFSPLHRRLALQPMTDFTWLSADRMIQKTTFADGTEILANFGRKAIRAEGIEIPAQTAAARSGDAVTFYTPAAR